MGVLLESGSEIRSQTAAIRTATASIVLHQNFPNPFNPTTTIAFTLPDRMPTNLSVYSPNGKLVKSLINRPLSSGYKAATWDGIDSQGNAAASGVYFYRLVAGNKILTKKMVILK